MDLKICLENKKNKNDCNFNLGEYFICVDGSMKQILLSSTLNYWFRFSIHLWLKCKGIIIGCLCFCFFLRSIRRFFPIFCDQNDGQQGQLNSWRFRRRLWIGHRWGRLENLIFSYRQLRAKVAPFVLAFLFLFSFSFPSMTSFAYSKIVVLLIIRQLFSLIWAFYRNLLRKWFQYPLNRCFYLSYCLFSSNQQLLPHSSSHLLQQFS